jgi:hypothetical protein
MRRTKNSTDVRKQINEMFSGYEPIVIKTINVDNETIKLIVEQTDNKSRLGSIEFNILHNKAILPTAFVISVLSRAIEHERGKDISGILWIAGLAAAATSIAVHLLVMTL